MYLILGMAAVAAASVLVYNAYKDSRPDMATQAARRTQQLAAVTLCLARAVEGVVEALALGLRPSLAGPASPSYREAERLIDQDWDGEGY
jgi:hypothetical protein